MTSQLFAGGLTSAYQTTKTTVTEYLPESVKPKTCPVYADTPFQDIERADLDVIFVFDVVDNPGDGRYAIHLGDNYHLQANYNLTNGFYAYTRFGQRSYEKVDVVDSVYDPKWTSRMLFGGIGIYLTPVVNIFGAVGKIWLVNENEEEPPLTAAIEYGVNYDIAWGANKVVLSWRIVEASLDMEEEPTAAELQGTGSFASGGIGLSVPFMR
jgi:hypothetical protein